MKKKRRLNIEEIIYPSKHVITSFGVFLLMYGRKRFSYKVNEKY